MDNHQKQQTKVSFQEINDSERSVGARFDFVGGHVCLDFANTVRIERGGMRDLLQEYGDLVDWLVAAGLVPTERASDFRKWEGTREGEAVLNKARDIRSAVRRLAGSLAEGKPLSVEALSLIDREFDEVPVRIHLAPGQESQRRADVEFEPVAGGPYATIGMLVGSILDYLRGPSLLLTKHCANPECAHFFLDTTKNGKRRWCSMRICGNRAKQAAYQERVRRHDQNKTGT